MIGDPTRGAQHLQLIRDRQPVAGLDLDRGGTAGDQLVDPGQGKGKKPVFAGSPRRVDGGQDTTTRAGNLGVADALQALLELDRAVAGMDRMGVAINQAGGDEAALQVPRITGAKGCGQIGHRAGPGDAVAVQCHGRVRDQAVASLAGNRSHRGEGGVDQEHPLALWVDDWLICLDIKPVK